jgi:hypothetical protein
MLACSRLVGDLRLLFVIFSLEDNLPPLSIFLLDHALQLTLFRQNFIVEDVLQDPLEGVVSVLNPDGADELRLYFMVDQVP